MGSIWLLGLLIGMRHALEADHVAAVASLATRRASKGRIALLGVVWGVGHTLTLLIASAAVLALDHAVPERFAPLLEFAVGLMLLMLGADVLVRAVRERIHFHVHRHRNGTVHLHAHGHPGGGSGHDPAHHEHPHAQGFPLRALAVGMMHGLAGSAALIVFTTGRFESVWAALGYVLVFGAGSVIGMGFLAGAIAVPLGWSGRAATWFHNGLCGALGAATLGLGAFIVVHNGDAVGSLLL